MSTDSNTQPTGTLERLNAACDSTIVRIVCAVFMLAVMTGWAWRGEPVVVFFCGVALFFMGVSLGVSASTEDDQ
jgi:hypothetical protein